MLYTISTPNNNIEWLERAMRHLLSPFVFFSKFRSQAAPAQSYPSLDDYIDCCRNMWQAAKAVRVDRDMLAVLTTSYVCDEPILAPRDIAALRSLSITARSFLKFAESQTVSMHAARIVNENVQQYVARTIQLDGCGIELFAATIAQLTTAIKNIEDRLFIEFHIERGYERSATQLFRIREKSFYVSAALNQLKKLDDQVGALRKVMDVISALDFIHTPPVDETSYYTRGQAPRYRSGV